MSSPATKWLRNIEKQGFTFDVSSLQICSLQTIEVAVINLKWSIRVTMTILKDSRLKEKKFDLNTNLYCQNSAIHNNGIFLNLVLCMQGCCISLWETRKLMSLVFSQMVEILFQYVERSLKKCPEQGKIQLLEQHFQVDETIKALVSPDSTSSFLSLAIYISLLSTYLYTVM